MPPSVTEAADATYGAAYLLRRSRAVLRSGMVARLEELKALRVARDLSSQARAGRAAGTCAGKGGGGGRQRPRRASM
eukprot:1672153-Rhodomonas_salina.2